MQDHHAAFDGGLLAVAEDLTIQISARIMSSEPGRSR
jgi:predicted N-formylglutamate amidohydrolase